MAQNKLDQKRWKMTQGRCVLDQRGKRVERKKMVNRDELRITQFYDARIGSYT